MTTMTEQPASPGPAEERRGGISPDWDRARPGEELPDQPDPELYPPDDTRLGPAARRIPGRHHNGNADWCGHPGCGGD